MLTKFGFTASISRRGNCWDNACSETLFGSLKVERLHGQRFVTQRAAKDEVIAWLLWCNQTRLHSTLNYVSPVQFEQDWFAAQSKLINSCPGYGVRIPGAMSLRLRQTDCSRSDGAGECRRRPIAAGQRSPWRAAGPHWNLTLLDRRAAGRQFGLANVERHPVAGLVAPKMQHQVVGGAQFHDARRLDGCPAVDGAGQMGWVVGLQTQGPTVDEHQRGACCR